jgi:hypothetical protein
LAPWYSAHLDRTLGILTTTAVDAPTAAALACVIPQKYGLAIP